MEEFKEGIHSWAAWIATVIGGIVSLAAAVRWLTPITSTSIDVITTARGLHKEFGPDAGAQIKRVLIELETAKDQQELLEEIQADHLGIGVYVCDADGKCIYTNRVLNEMFGLDAADMLGFGWLSPIENRQKCFKEWEFAVRNRTPYETEYVVNNRRSGKRFAVFTRAIRKDRKDKSLECFVGFVKPKDHIAGFKLPPTDDAPTPF